MTELGDWWCDEQDELDLDDGYDDEPNPDDARDLRIDDDLLDEPFDHAEGRAIEDVDVRGDLL